MAPLAATSRQHFASRLASVALADGVMCTSDTQAVQHSSVALFEHANTVSQRPTLFSTSWAVQLPVCLLVLLPKMTQGRDRRLRFLGRKRKEPLPWLKHKLYLFRLWTGAYMLDDWEVVLLVLIFGAFGFYLYSVFFAEATVAEAGKGM